MKSRPRPSKWFTNNVFICLFDSLRLGSVYAFSINESILTFILLHVALVFGRKTPGTSFCPAPGRNLDRKLRTNGGKCVFYLLFKSSALGGKSINRCQSTSHTQEKDFFPCSTFITTAGATLAARVNSGWQADVAAVVGEGRRWDAAGGCAAIELLRLSRGYIVDGRCDRDVSGCRVIGAVNGRCVRVERVCRGWMTALELWGCGG